MLRHVPGRHDGPLDPHEAELLRRLRRVRRPPGPPDPPGGTAAASQPGVDGQEGASVTPEQAAQLRAPFKPEQIGVLPKPTKKDNPRGHCNECGGWHGLPAVHLDYVGHAATTDRLLAVDPDWSWEPMAVGPNGEPLMVNGGMWIRLTVAGVTRPGFGDGANPKEIIGDAIRNAAMRFGVALDLWAKEPLHVDDEPAAPAAVKIEQWQHKRIGELCGNLADASAGAEEDKNHWASYSRGWIKEQYGKTTRADLTKGEASELIAHLEATLKALEVPFG